MINILFQNDKRTEMMSLQEAKAICSTTYMCDAVEDKIAFDPLLKDTAAVKVVRIIYVMISNVFYYHKKLS